MTETEIREKWKKKKYSTLFCELFERKRERESQEQQKTNVYTFFFLSLSLSLSLIPLYIFFSLFFSFFLFFYRQNFFSSSLERVKIFWVLISHNLFLLFLAFLFVFFVKVNRANDFFSSFFPSFSRSFFLLSPFSLRPE